MGWLVLLSLPSWDSRASVAPTMRRRWFPLTAVAVRATQTTASECTSGIGSCGRAAGGGGLPRLPQPGESDPPVSPTEVSDPHQSLMGITDRC